LADKLYAKAQLIEGCKIALDDGRAHSYVVNLPSETSEGYGPTSLELCVMSHAGCYATIFALTAAKMRIPLKGLEVKVEAVKTDEAGTITEETFNTLVKSDAPEDRIERCHKLTLSCPVGIILEKAGVKVTYSLKTTKT
jgi:uncharacterized OsmC-like protein